MKRADLETAERLIAILAASLRAEANTFAREGRDLSPEARIIFRLEFIDADCYDGDEDDVWAPATGGSALLWALLPSPRRGRSRTSRRLGTPWCLCRGR